MLLTLLDTYFNENKVCINLIKVEKNILLNTKRLVYKIFKNEQSTSKAIIENGCLEFYFDYDSLNALGIYK